MDGNVLRIHGQRSFDREVNEEDMFLSERIFGSFTRDLVLPEGIDPDQLSAAYDSGVLTVTMPVASALGPKTRRIPVTNGGTAPTAIETRATEQGEAAESAATG